MKLCWPLGLMLLLLMSPMLIAQDDDKKEDSKQEDPTVAEQFVDAKRAFSKVEREYRRKARKAEAGEQEAIIKEAEEMKAELIAEIIELSGKAEGDAEAVPMLQWIIDNGGEEAKDAATMKIVTDYVESEEIADFARNLARQPGAKAEKMLRKLINKNPHDQVKGYATMSLAFMLSGLNRGNELEGARRDQFIERLGDGGEEYMNKWSKEAIDEEVIKLFENIVENYADVSAGRGGNLGEMAEGRLFTLKYLQIGKVAPDIEGADLDEVDFKLSDYRGKVVVLDFWGDW